MKKVTIFDVEKMSQEIETPVNAIKAALGIPFDATLGIEGVKELKDVYWSLPEGSEAKKEALEKWSVECIKVAAHTDTILDAEALYMQSPTDSDAQNVVLDNWRNIFENILLTASDVKEALVAYHNYPAPYHKSDKARAWAKVVSLAKTAKEAQELWLSQRVYKEPNTPEAQLAQDKWDELSLQEVEDATTIEAIKQARSDARHNTTAYNRALGKWIELSEKLLQAAETHLEAKQVFELCPRDSDSDIAKSSVEKWEQLCIQAVTSVETLAEALELYKNCPFIPSFNYPFEAKARQGAYLKCVELAQTLKDLNSIPNVGIKGEVYEIFKKKRLELCQKEFENITTLEQAKDVYNYSPTSSEFKTLALKRIASFFGYEGN